MRSHSTWLVYVCCVTAEGEILCWTKSSSGGGNRQRESVKSVNCGSVLSCGSWTIRRLEFRTRFVIYLLVLCVLLSPVLFNICCTFCRLLGWEFVAPCHLWLVDYTIGITVLPSIYTIDIILRIFNYFSRFFYYNKFKK